MERIVERLSVRHAFVLTLIAVFSIAAYVVLGVIIDEEDNAAAQVNVAGRQRMLMQRTVLMASEVDRLPEGPARQSARESMAQAMDMMAVAHDGLVRGDPALELSPLDSSAMLGLYFGPTRWVDRDVRTFLAQGKAFLIAHGLEFPEEPTLCGHSESFLEEVNSDLLVSLDAVVSQYQRESEAKISRLKIVHFSFLIGTLLLLLLSAFGVFRPMAIRINESIARSKRLEHSLRSAKNAAEAATRAKADFLANMSHEIRTPMNGVIGMLELLAGTALTEVQRHYAQTAMRSAEMQLDIINSILDFSKIEAGKLDLESIRFDLTAVVEEISTLMAELAHGKGLELACFVSPDAPGAVRGDPTRLRQILSNLIGNAVKFTERGEVSIRATVENDTSDFTRVRIEVRDTGIGIDAESMGALFQSFTQADTSMTRRFGGTGLGLAISKKLVELMGGQIGVDSEPGTGSTFWVSIPFEKAEPLARMDTASLRGLNVLVVDDNATNRDVLGRYLESWGMRHTDAEGGAQALDILRGAKIGGERFALAILDLHMPEMSGIDLAKHIQSDMDIDPPRLMMLSSSSSLDMTELEYGGVKARLNKPVRQSQLFDSITMLVFGEDHLALSQDEDGSRRVLSGTILLVEDTYINQAVVLGMLAQLGLMADLAANGRDAVEMTAKKRYDLALMDVQMPEMDGFAATAAIREREKRDGLPHLPIVATTAHAMRGDRERCLDSGMDDYLSKPIRRDELERKLGFWLMGDAADVPSFSGTVPLKAGEMTTGLDMRTLEALRASLATIPNGMGRVFGNFLKSAPILLGEIRAGLAAGDAQALFRSAHSLKSNAATVGAMALSQLATDIEHIGREGRTDGVEAVLIQAETAFARLCPEIEALLT